MRRLVWTPELVTGFWDGVAQIRGLAQQSFGRLGGRHLLQAVRWHLVPGQRHLDFGGGDGDFAALLAEAGFPTAVYEPAPERAAKVTARLAGQPGFLGTVGHDDVAQFDTIFLVEVIEHVLDSELDAVLARLDSLLAPGGRIIITTPNAEDLEQNLAYEPAQGVLFHRWQHQRSLTRDSLSQLMADHGFAPSVVHEIELTDRIFAARGAGLGCRPEFANLFNTDRPLTIGDGESLVWIGGRAGEVAADPDEQGWRAFRLTLRAETRLVPPPEAAEAPRLPPADYRRCPHGMAELRLPPEQIFHGEGLAYGFHVPAKLPAGDTMEAPQASPLELFEDGLPLGPGHNMHVRIRELGGGRFSHWGGMLHFASSDGSDPRRNGRAYVLRWWKHPAVPVLGPKRFLLPPEVIQPVAGRAFRATLPDCVPAGDRSEDEPRSTLALYEDHLPLGPAHAARERIVELGRGRYTHQGSVLLFSASDGTEPRDNGRRYTLVWPSGSENAQRG